MRRIREKLRAWVTDMWRGKRTAKVVQGGQERKERLRADGCQETAKLVRAVYTDLCM
jgi:hypothetical protein